VITFHADMRIQDGFVDGAHGQAALRPHADPYEHSGSDGRIEKPGERGLWVERHERKQCGIERSVLGRLKCIPELSSPFNFVAVQIGGCRRYRRMTQIIPNRCQLRTAHERVGRVRVSHPMRAS